MPAYEYQWLAYYGRPNETAPLWGVGPDPNRPTQPLPSGGFRPIPPPPPSGPRGPRAGGILLGIGAALVIIAALVAFLVTQRPGLLAGSAPLAHATVTATHAPALTPTVTIAPSPTDNPANQIPTPPAGFTTYTATDNAWGMNYPEDAQIARDTYTLNDVAAPATSFTFADSSRLSVIELPAALSQADPQTLFDAIVTATQATDVQILQQPTPVTLGANTWQRVEVTADIQGAATQADIYYAQQGSNAYALVAFAPVDSFTAADDATFQPMVTTFTVLAPQ